MTITMPPEAERAALAKTRGLGGVKRQYAVTGIELRAATDESPFNFYGHASVTGRAYPMYGGPDKGGWDETVTPGAFKQTLADKPAVPLLLNHSGTSMALTTNGTLELAEDTVGLSVKALLDTNRSDVNDMVLALKRGDLNEMSFAFRVVQDEWLDAEGEQVAWWDLAGITRNIGEVSINKGDVSVVNFGANPFTDASSRGLDDLIELLGGADPAAVRGFIDRLQGLLPADELSDEKAVAAMRAYYADMQQLHARRQPAA